MWLERAGGNQIKIFVSAEELAERGISEEDVATNSLKWHQLFFEMVNRAHDELGIALEGTILIDVTTVGPQGIVILFTVFEEDYYIDYYLFPAPEKKREPNPDGDLLYSFHDIEHIIQLAKGIGNFYDDGALYFYDGRYYLLFPVENREERILPLVSEYGEKSNKDAKYVKEHGKVILEKNAFKYLRKYFLDC